MGNSSSSHQPLERAFTRGTFGDVKNVVCTTFIISNYFFFFVSKEQGQLSEKHINLTGLIEFKFLIYRNQHHSVQVKNHQKRWIV